MPQSWLGPLPQVTGLLASTGLSVLRSSDGWMAALSDLTPCSMLHFHLEFNTLIALLIEGNLCIAIQVKRVESEEKHSQM